MYTFTKAEGNSNVFITDNNGNNFILPGNTQVKNDGDNIIFWITGTIGIQSISLNYQTQIDWANCDPVQSTPANITDAMNVLYKSFFFSVSGGSGGTNFWEETESTAIKNKPAYEGGYFRRVTESSGSIRVHLIGTAAEIDDKSSGIVITTDNGDIVAGLFATNELSSGGFVKSVNTLQTLGYYGTFQNVGEDTVNSGFAVFGTPNGNLIVSAQGNGIIEITQTDVQGSGKKNTISLQENGDIKIAKDDGSKSISLTSTEIKMAVERDNNSIYKIAINDLETIELYSENTFYGNAAQVIINTNEENPSISFDLAPADGATKNYMFRSIPSYPNHAAADADTTLNINSLYLIDSQQSVNVKK